MAHDAFARDLAEVINRHSVENVSDTPDIVLGEFLVECLDAFDAAVNARAELVKQPNGQPQDSDVQAARAWLADLSENIRSYHQSIPGQPGCTCGRSRACGTDVPDYAAIWTLEAALDAWVPTEEAEQPQDERDGDVRAYPGRPGDGWSDCEGDIWVHCADGQMRLINEAEEPEDPAELNERFGPMLPLDAREAKAGER